MHHVRLSDIIQPRATCSLPPHQHLTISFHFPLVSPSYGSLGEFRLSLDWPAAHAQPGAAPAPDGGGSAPDSSAPEPAAGGEGGAPEMGEEGGAPRLRVKVGAGQWYAGEGGGLGP